MLIYEAMTVDLILILFLCTSHKNIARSFVRKFIRSICAIHLYDPSYHRPRNRFYRVIDGSFPGQLSRRSKVVADVNWGTKPDNCCKAEYDGISVLGERARGAKGEKEERSGATRRKRKREIWDVEAAFGIDRRQREIFTVLLASRIFFLAARPRSQTERNRDAESRKRPISKHNQRTQLIIIAICYRSRVYANTSRRGR